MSCGVAGPSSPHTGAVECPGAARHALAVRFQRLARRIASLRPAWSKAGHSSGRPDALEPSSRLGLEDLDQGREVGVPTVVRASRSTPPRAATNRPMESPLRRCIGRSVGRVLEPVTTMGSRNSITPLHMIGRSSAILMICVAAFLSSCATSEFSGNREGEELYKKLLGEPERLEDFFQA